MKILKIVLTCGIAVVAGATAASATHLTILSHSTDLEDFLSVRPLSNTYNDSGMSGDSGSANATNDTHINTAEAGGMIIGRPTNPYPGYLEYDLGESFSLTNLVIWNYNEPAWYIQGIKKATIEIRELAGPSTVVFDGDIPAAPGAGGGPTTASLDIDLTGEVARFIRFNTGTPPDHNHASNPTDCCVGISEVRVYGDPTGLGNTNTTEACCFIDGTCQQMESADCLSAGGTPQGGGAECLTTTCPQIEEACCFDDGTCDDIDPNVCAGTGGIAQGSGTTCATTACPQPEACCFDDGTCQDLLTTDCTTGGGVWQGFFSSCASAPCPQREACCFSDETCQDLLPALCTGALGTPAGTGTVCATASCVPATETVATDALEMGFVAVEDGRYDLERATSLNPDWTDLPSYLEGSDTNLVLVGDNNSDPQAFYRYSALEPPTGCGLAPAIGNPSVSNNWDTTSAVSVFTPKVHDARPVIHLINGSGLDQTGCFHTDDVVNTMGFNAGPSSPERWGAGGTQSRYWTEFAFDQAYDIFDILIWNYNEDLSPNDGPDPGGTWSMQGMKEVTIKYTTVGNGSGFGSDTESDWTTLDLPGGSAPHVFQRGSGDQKLPAETIPMDATAQYVIFLGADSAECNFMNDFGVSSTSHEGALSEVRFTLAEAPPAPPLPEQPIDTLARADVTGLTFTSISGTVYELERASKVGEPVFEGTGAFTVGDSTDQTLYDPNGWDSDNYLYRVVPR